MPEDNQDMKEIPIGDLKRQMRPIRERSKAEGVADYGLENIERKTISESQPTVA